MVAVTYVKKGIVLLTVHLRKAVDACHSVGYVRRYLDTLENQLGPDVRGLGITFFGYVP